MHEYLALKIGADPVLTELIQLRYKLKKHTRTPMVD